MKSLFKYRIISDPLYQIRFPDQMSNSKTSLFHEWEGQGFYLAQYKTPELAIFSYYLESEGQAVLIDPTYDVYMYNEIAAKRKAKLTSILLTHYHADYVAGHTEFNLPIIMGPKAKRSETPFKLFEMQDAYTFNLGSIWLKVLHTPGHTPESSCFQLIDAKKNETCLFTGDCVFLGEVGRPDLAASSNVTKEDLAIMLFHSLQKIRNEVKTSARIYPTHGAGSSCGKSISDGNFCTLEKQLETNYAFNIKTQKEFVEKIMNEMPKAPSYFFHDAKINVTGGASHFQNAFANCNKGLTPEQFKAELDKGCFCIDSRLTPNDGIIQGAYWMIEKGPIASWTGLVIPPGTSLILFTEEGRAQDLIERLLRIGYFDIKGYNNFKMEDWKNKGFPAWSPKIVNAKAAFEDANRTHVDVRNLGEWKKGIIEGAKCITLGQISDRHKEVSELPNVYVNCKTGGRAKLASSILAKNGVSSTIVGDDLDALPEAGFKIVEYAA